MNDPLESRRKAIDVCAVHRPTRRRVVASPPVGPSLLLLAAVLGGLALVRRALPGEGPALWLPAGLVAGLTLQALLGFLLASLFGLCGASVLATGVLSAAPILLAVRPGDASHGWRSLGPSGGPPSPAGLAYAAALALLLWLVFDRAFYETAQGIFTGDSHNLGDLSFHLAVTSGFAHGANFPPEHPELAGARLTYPFLVDFGAALLVRAGATERTAYLLQNLLLAGAFVALLHLFTLRLTGDRQAARLAPLLVLCSGGLGFAAFVRDALAHDAGLVAFLSHLPRDYTIAPDGLRWGNALTTLLVPQRALVLGAPLVLAVWTLLWSALEQAKDPPQRRRRMGAAGVLTGLLPLAHTHGFVAAFGTALMLVPLFRRAGRDWLRFFVPAILLGLPQGLWLAHGSSLSADRFLAIQSGWDRGALDPVSFWLLNTGAFLPLLALAYARIARGSLLRFALPPLAFFVVPNLLRLSPWIWDNIKFLFFWYLASVPFVALLLARLARASRPGLAAAGLLTASLVFSGALDVFRVASRQVELQVFEVEGVAFATEVLSGAPPRALILHSPTFDAPALLSGRRSLLGYPGHIWSQGLDAGTREADIARIYAGEPEASALLRRYGVDFIVVGPQERRDMRVDGVFLEGVPLVARRGRYELRRAVRP